MLAITLLVREHFSPAMICRRATKSLINSNTCDQAFVNLSLWLRCYSSSTATVETAKPSLDPSVTAQPIRTKPASNSSKDVQSLQPKTHQSGSRRSRAAIKSCLNLPFEKLPYQCFQEARKVLQSDREEKVRQIQTQRQRIARLLEKDASTVGGEKQKGFRLESMKKHLEHLKILADINDPLVKKRFEDGHGLSSLGLWRS